MSIDEGVKQLQKAEKKQKNSFKVLCIMILAAAIMLMLIVVIVKNILF